MITFIYRLHYIVIVNQTKINNVNFNLLINNNTYILCCFKKKILIYYVMLVMIVLSYARPNKILGPYIFKVEPSNSQPPILSVLNLSIYLSTRGLDNYPRINHDSKSSLQLIQEFPSNQIYS